MLDAGRETPLPAGFRTRLERVVGYDLSEVRICEGAAARRLGVLAFASGSHVHVAEGLYRPDTRWGQALLAHEVAHVVQQYEGRVGAPQAGIVADPRLEAEADEVARGYLRGHTGAVPRRRLRAFRPAVPVLQPAVGFEFQLHSWRAYMEFPGGRLVEFPKETPLYGGRNSPLGWSLETDGSELEVVVEPPIEESTAGMSELTRVFGSMSAYLTQLELAKNHPRITPQSHPNLFRAGGKIVILPPQDSDKSIRSQPQLTVGVRLGRVHRMLEEMARLGLQSVTDVFDREGLGSQFYSRQYDKAARAGINAPNVNGQPASPRLKGLVSMVAQYLLQGMPAARRDYAKDIAYAMARTDFVAMFQKLPTQEKAYFQADPRRWVTYALQAAGLPATSGGVPLVRQLIKDGGKSPIPGQLPITRGQWLHDMAKPVGARDLFSKKGAGDAPGFRDAMGGHRLKAPGLLGNKMDDVGGTHKGVIIELRQMRTHIPFNRWYGIARDVLSYLIQLNSSSEQANVQFQ